jgi:hypothetical protein
MSAGEPAASANNCARHVRPMVMNHHAEQPEGSGQALLPVLGRIRRRQPSLRHP